MFGEMRTPSLVRTSSLYFHKARTLRHTSALLRYNASSPRWYFDFRIDKNGTQEAIAMFTS